MRAARNARSIAISGWLRAACALAMVASGSLQAQSLQRVLGPAAAEPNALLRDPAVSPDGGHIVFATAATNLSPTFGGVLNIYRYDVASGAIDIVSRNAGGTAADGNCLLPSASADGRFVVFESLASNLGPPGSGLQIFRVDMTSGSVARASQSQSGTPGNDQSRFAAVSGDGRHVAFQSFADNLVAADNNARADIFVKDLDSGAVEVVSRDASGLFANDNAAALTPQALSADARFVVFASVAANMVAGMPGGTQQVYLRDRQTATTTLISRAANGDPGNQQSDQAAISANGRHVLFRSFASNLIAAAGSRLFALDRQTGQLAAVPLPTAAAFTPPLSGGASACRGARVSNAGDVVFVCDMAAPASAQVFRWLRATGQLELVSRGLAGPSAFGNALSGANVGISGDGATLAFESQASNLVSGDLNGVADLFYRAAVTAPVALFKNGFE
jgi:dipeptidyl aminopeptidase/acylaminoacyl peptidase